MKITDEMIEKASKAYAEKRHPSRWDGEPWGAAGKENHRRAIKNALNVIFKGHTMKKPYLLYFIAYFIKDGERTSTVIEEGYRLIYATDTFKAMEMLQSFYKDCDLDIESYTFGEEDDESKTEI